MRAITSAFFTSPFRTCIVALFHVLLCVTPLFFLTVNEELFEFNKMLVTYAVTIGIAGLWIADMIVRKKILWKNTPLTLPLLIFIASQVFSTITSIHPHTSIFGYYTRFHGGLLSTFSYSILFFATQVYLTKKDLRPLLHTLLITSFLVSLYAIPEHFGISPSCLWIAGKADVSCWVQDVQTRVFATFGQPNWLAAYVIMVFPFSFLSIIRTGWQRYFGLLCSAGLLLTLLFTKSRSGFLGLIVSSMLAMIVIVAQRLLQKKTLVPQHYRGILGLFFFLTLTIMGVFGTPFTPSLAAQLKSSSSAPTTTTTPTVANRLDVGGTDSGEIRKIVWQGAIDVWKRYPLFGSGVETFAYSYYKDRSLAHNMVSEWDFLYNKAHNELLNLLATTGIIGLGTYAIWQLAIFFFLIRTVFVAHTTHTRFLALATLASLTGFHISNFFGFSTVMISAFLFFLPALVLVSHRESDDSAAPQSNRTTVTAAQWIALGGTLVITFIGLMSVHGMWWADFYYASAKQRVQLGQLTDAQSAIEHAITLAPNEAQYYELQSKILAQLAIAYVQDNKEEAANQLAQAAIDASNRSVMLNPVHLNIYRSRMQMFVTLAQAQAEFYDEALKSLDQAEILAPTDPKVVFNRGIIYMTMGKNSEAITALEKAVEMKPNYEAARYNLGQLYEQEQQFDQAKKQYTAIIETINPTNELVQERLDTIATQSGKKK